MAAITPGPVAPASNRDRCHGDKSPTNQKSPDASFESLTTRLRPHEIAGTEKKRN
jgi:hypothetical protein